MDWGDVATWVGSIGTTATLIVAILLAKGERSKARRVEAATQASQVSAWLEIASFPEPKVVLVVRNQSKGAVNDFCGIIADYAFVGRPEIEIWIPGVPPSGDRITLVLDVEPPAELQRYRYELTYEFSDSANRRWRHERGLGLVLKSQRAPRVSYDALGIPSGGVGDARPARPES